MKEDEATARLEGQIAAVQNKPPSANPYPMGDYRSRAFSRGYREIASAK